LSGHGQMLRGVGALIVTMMLQAGSAFLFWVAATRLIDVDQVGIATAMVASATFVTYVTGFGIQFALARFASDDSPSSRRYFALGSLLSSSTSVVGAILYLLFATTVWGGEGAGTLAVFVVIAGAVVLNALVDTRLLALGRRRVVIGRALGVALSRLLLLCAAWALTIESGPTIFVLMLLPDAVTGVVGALILARGRGRLIGGDKWDRGELGRAGRMAMISYISQLGMQAPAFVIPVVAIWVLEVNEYGAFYIAWAVVNLVLFLPQAVAMSLHIEAGRSHESFHRQVRVAMAIAVGATGAATLISVVAAPLLVVIFGDDYSKAATYLPWLVLGSIPWSIVVIISVEIRLVGRSVIAGFATIAEVILALVPAAVLGSSMGLSGLAGGWCGGALVAAILLMAIRRFSHLDDKRLSQRDP